MNLQFCMMAIVIAVISGNWVMGKEPVKKELDQNQKQVEEPVEKVKKITFVQDDDQYYMVSKIYELKHILAADVAPFIKSAVMRFNSTSSVSSLNDQKRNRQLLLVSTPEDMIPYVDNMIVTLDRPGKIVGDRDIIDGTGIAYGTYMPQYRAMSEMKKNIENGNISSGIMDSRIEMDPKTNVFYFKDSPSRVAEIKEKLAWFDKPLPQVRLTFDLYEISKSDLRDIGLDYLAWKNGPGLNILELGYEALNLRSAETVFNAVAQNGVDLFGNFGYGFGGMMTAPAFDLSFIRLLQQNNKAIHHSSANLVVSNNLSKVFHVQFSPEYQNIVKDEDHRSSVVISDNSDLSLSISNVWINNEKEGIVHFTYSIIGNHVLARNHHGTEIREKTNCTGASSVSFAKGKILMNYEKESTVEQVIGIPVLCDIPVLKYFFGTTTQETETVCYYVVASAELINLEQKMNSEIITIVR